MRDFLGQLDARLSAIALETAAHEPAIAEAAAVPAPPVRRRPGRPALLGTMAAVVTAAGATFALTGTSLADLPILTTPVTDASGLRSALPAVAAKGVDFTKAHAFATPGGPGYVLTTPKTETLCIAVPDPATPGNYGSNCGAPLEQVERDGLMSELAADASQRADAGNLVAFLMPNGARDIRLTAGGRTTRPKLQSGVMVAEVRTNSTLTWTADGHPFRRTLAGPFRDTTFYVACPDGSKRVIELPRDVADGTAAGAARATLAIRSRTQKACAR